MNKKGFTLVELVVVIAIIGVLAAILIPTMMSYIKKAKLKSANSNAKIVFNTVNSVVTDMQCEGKMLTSDPAQLLLIAPLSLTLQKNLKKLSMMH
jgi:prepilin-type N-terminal cleavage/methylation domain-containing protein